MAQSASLLAGGPEADRQGERGVLCGDLKVAATWTDTPFDRLRVSGCGAGGQDKWFEIREGGLIVS